MFIVTTGTKRKKATRARTTPTSAMILPLIFAAGSKLRFGLCPPKPITAYMLAEMGWLGRFTG